MPGFLGVFEDRRRLGWSGLARRSTADLTQVAADRTAMGAVLHANATSARMAAIIRRQRQEPRVSSAVMINIVPYDLEWPAQFHAEAVNIRAELGDLALHIEHVGSTAVPGTAAKPVIDIQVSVATLERLDIYGEPLGRLGYRHIALGDFDLVYPWFRKPVEGPSTHHVHLCVFGGEQERRHLAFRDYLRSHPAVAAEYVRLKRRLASVHGGATLESCERYSLSKTEFVTSVLERALGRGSSPEQP